MAHQVDIFIGQESGEGKRKTCSISMKTKHCRLNA